MILLGKVRYCKMQRTIEQFWTNSFNTTRTIFKYVPILINVISYILCMSRSSKTQNDCVSECVCMQKNWKYENINIFCWILSNICCLKLAIWHNLYRILAIHYSCLLTNTSLKYDTHFMIIALRCLL